MKKIFRSLVALSLALMLLIPCALSVNAAVNVSQLATFETFESKINPSFVLNYRLIVPQNYDASKSYPVIMFLHGAGERGSDNTKQLNGTIQNMFDTYPAKMEQSIVIVPQCPAGNQWVNHPWANGNYTVDNVPMSRALTAAYELLQEILGKYSCDRDRVYAMGLSMGGFGTWDLLMRYPDTFAAGVPICGGGDPGKAEILKNIPIWTRHGTADPTVPYRGTEEMYNSIKAAGGEKIVFESVEGGEHNVWTDLTRNPELFKWLFSQKLSDRFPKEEVTTVPEEVTTPETKPVTTNEEDGGCKGSVISFAVPAVIALAATAVFKKKEKR